MAHQRLIASSWQPHACAVSRGNMSLRKNKNVAVKQVAYTKCTRGGSLSTRSRAFDGTCYNQNGTEARRLSSFDTTHKACRRPDGKFTASRCKYKPNATGVGGACGSHMHRLPRRDATARHEFGESALAPEIEACTRLALRLLLHIDDLVACEPHGVILALQ